MIDAVQTDIEKVLTVDYLQAHKEHIEEFLQGTTMISEYIQSLADVKDLEAKKKQAAIDEDFELALDCKKKITQTQETVKTLIENIRQSLLEKSQPKTGQDNLKTISQKDLLLKVLEVKPEVCQVLVKIL